MIVLFSSSGMGNEEPVSIPSMVKRNANEVPDVPALKSKDPKTGKEVSYSFVFNPIIFSLCLIVSKHPF